MTTNDDGIIVYLNARREFEAARAAASQAGAFLSEVGRALQQAPDRMQFAGMGQGMPSEAATSPASATFNPDELRSASEITALLVRYHDARQRTHAGWVELSPHQRQGLQPPPEDPTRR